MADSGVPRVPKILALDGGGVRGLSSLLILREVMEEIGNRTGADETPKPCEYFDLIGGTSTGGLIAIMLGLLGMTVDECIGTYTTMSQEIFRVDHVLAGRIPVGDDACRFDFNALETKVKELVEQRLGDKDHIISAKPKPPNTPMQCNTFVVAQMAGNVTAPPTIFRSYTVEGVSKSKCTIWEAARATSAAPSFFKPMTIKNPPPDITYVDGGLGYNNPAQLAKVEAQRIWKSKNQKVCLVSIGTGQQSATSVIDESQLENNLDTQRSLFKEVRSSLSSLANNTLPYWKTAKNIPPGILALLKMAGALTSIVTNTEAVHDALQREADQQFPYFRFNVHRDVGDIGLEDCKKVGAMTTHTRAYMMTYDLEQRKIMCAKCLIDPNTFNLEKSQPRHEPDELPSIDNFVVPFERNPLFTGREEFLERLKEMMFDQAPKKYNHRIALYGMGGIGKTQTTLEYVYRNRDSYERIYWITAVDQASLLSGYQKIAPKAGLKTILNLEAVEIAERVLSWLRKEQSWLLVIDNLDDITVAVGYLPENGPHRHTLITTRNPNSIGIPAEGVEVLLPNSGESVDLLCALSNVVIVANPRESKQAGQIVQELGYLPLAIEQAAAYVREVAGDFTTFLEHYHESQRDVYEWIPQGNRPYPYSVATTWSMSFETVRKSCPQAAELLRLLSFLNPDSILIDFLKCGVHAIRNGLRQLVSNLIKGFLKRGVNAIPNDLRQLVSNKREMPKALIQLEKFSLIKWNRLTNTIVIHRLVQAVIRDQLPKKERTTFCKTVLNICDEAFPKKWNNDTRPICRIYSGQVFTPLLNIKSVQNMKLADTMERVGNFLFEDGKYNDRTKLLREVVQIRAAYRGTDDPSTLTSMHNLAETYRQQGKLREAAKMQEEVLAKRKTILGDDHPSTLTSMNNLALTYQQQGKLIEAANMHEEELAKCKTILGEDHPDTLTSMHNLALTYQQQGKLTEATKMQENVLAKRKTILGEDHPSTLTSMHNLAETYQQQGKSTEAAKMQEEVLAKRKTILGEDYPSTLTSMHNLASTYRQLGKLTEATKMYEEVLAKHKTILGEDHPDTLTTMNNLALTYRQQGKLREAAKMQEEVLAKRKTILGADHPDILASMHVLEHIQQGRFS